MLLPWTAAFITGRMEKSVIKYIRIFTNDVSEVKHVKAEKISMIIGILVIILLGILIFVNLGIVGVAENKLEQDARKDQNISSDWQMVQDINEDMCVMLFYNEAKSDCRYSVYETHDGISYGYFLIDGGADGFLIDSSRSMVYEDRGIALLSMNKDKVCRIEVGSGAVEAIQVDPSKPFAVVLPVNCGEITLYDAQNNVVTLYDTFAG